MRFGSAATLAVCAFALVPCGGSADPAERVSTESDQTRVNVTIYSGGAALVHDRRRITFAKGANRIAWRDVSGMLDPTSAIVRDLSAANGLAVVEQNFDFSLLTPASLLAKFVGRDVTIVHDVAIPGLPRRERARVLANNDGIVLQYADRIETDLTGSHVSFFGLPADLRERPTLLLDLQSARQGAQDVDLAYLSSGLGWHADYVGVVSSDKKHMDLNGLVTLTNTSGTTYRGARLQLVAGNVNLALGDTVNSEDGAPIGRMAPAPTPAPMVQESYFEYHLYTLARPTTIANAQTKQVALLSAHDVPIRTTLELRGSDVYYASANADLGAKLPIGAYVTFTNKGGDLGVPLPGGVVRLYENDRRGTSQFLGADRIDHTPKNEDVRLHVGDSFDVTADKKQTDFKTIGGCTFESSYDIRLANAKDVAQDVDVVEPIPGDWSILSENLPHRRTSSATATWHVRIPPDAHTTLTYRARAGLSVTDAVEELAFTHLNLDVRDLDVSERFYGDVLGMPIERRDATLRLCRPGFLIVLARGEPKMGGTFHFGFRVGTRDAVDAWFARLRTTGAAILIEPNVSGAAYVGRIADPDGYPIEIYADLPAA